MLSSEKELRDKLLNRLKGINARMTSSMQQQQDTSTTSMPIDENYENDAVELLDRIEQALAQAFTDAQREADNFRAQQQRQLRELEVLRSEISELRLTGDQISPSSVERTNKIDGNVKANLLPGNSETNELTPAKNPINNASNTPQQLFLENQNIKEQVTLLQERLRHTQLEEVVCICVCVCYFMLFTPSELLSVLPENMGGGTN